MAILKIKLRNSSIPGKPGTLYYQVSHRQIVRHITTDMHILPEHWDGNGQRILPGLPDASFLQNRLDSDMILLHRIVDELTTVQLQTGRPYTTEQVIARFRNPGRFVSVLDFMNGQIRFLSECNRLGTALNYRRAADSLALFLNGRCLLLSELTARFIEQYSDHLLRKGLVRNSVSFHMRILRAVYNKAVRCGIVEQTHPFRNVYTGIDRTRKRAVGENVIARLIRMDLPDNAQLALTRDMFVFSFYTRGMSFVDMVYLRKTDIQEGIIRYARHKTGQQLAVRVEPCIRDIIDRYAGPTPYVFPVLRGEEQIQCFNQYKTALRHYNRRLEKLSRLLGMEHGISSYTSRHTWATMARNHNIPISIISAGMGHSSERTTQIYLSTLENSVIDSANHDILEALKRVGQTSEREEGFDRSEKNQYI